MALCTSAGVGRVGATSQQAGQPKANQSEAKGLHLRKVPYTPEVPLQQNPLFSSQSTN